MTKNYFLSPAPWVAWRTYTTVLEARSIIANEKRHEKIFLEDESARLWAFIEKGIFLNDLIIEAQRLDAENELIDFISELNNLELIFSEGDDINLAKANPAPEPKDIEHAENTAPELEFQQWVMSHGFMYSAHWELTYRCNERCTHCYNPGAAHLPSEVVSRNTNELSTEKVFSTLDSLAAGGVFSLTLSGGEIMLRKDFFEVVSYARKLGMAVNIYTNGLRLDEASVEKLAVLWPSSVGVSIYSNNPETHDQITKIPGSYIKSVAALSVLNLHGVRTSLKSVQFSHTLPAYFGVRELARSLGAVSETELGLSPGADGAIAPMLMSTTNPSELIVAAMTPGFPIYVGDKASNFGEFIKDKKATVCSAGITGLNFGADGNIYPCNSLPIKSGNLHTHDPLKIWNSALVQRKKLNDNQARRISNIVVDPSLLKVTNNLSQWQDIRLEDYEECGTHRRCNWCVKCPGMAMMETGRPLAPSTTNCRIATARMFAAILLSKGLSKDAVANRLGVSMQYGNESPRKFKEVDEPRDRTEVKLQPRNLTNVFSKGDKLSNLSKGGNYITPNGESWLKNGSKWNIEGLKSFEPIRETFEELQISIE